MAEFEVPAFLENQSPEEIHERMKGELPEDIDVSDGSVIHDLTYSAAYVLSEMAEFNIVEALKMIFPMFASGVYLDYHAQSRNMRRRAATKAVGVITVTGGEDTEIPMGSTFSTIGNHEVEAIAFETLEDAVITGEGVDIPVAAVNAGADGNVIAGSIVMNTTEGLTILSVTNAEATSGGYDEEDDESLSERIAAFDSSEGNSYIGNIADYRRWALSVQGVGAVTVIPAQDDTGMVTIVVTDQSGLPASEELCQEVYDYIMAPEDPTQRLAPINAVLTVSPPETTTVNITAKISLTTDGTTALAKTEFVTAIKEYLLTAQDEGKIKYAKIVQILMSNRYVTDCDDVTLNGGTDNIELNSEELPTISESTVSFTEGDI